MGTLRDEIVNEELRVERTQGWMLSLQVKCYDSTCKIIRNRDIRSLTDSESV